MPLQPLLLHRNVGRISAILIILAVVGCGRATPSRHPQAHLAGSVSADGKPIRKGNINFLATGSGQAGATMARIADGRYDAENVPLGRVLVRFSATEETGEVNDEGRLKLKNLIPEKYRDGIEIEVTGDDLQRNFELVSELAAD